MKNLIVIIGAVMFSTTCAQAAVIEKQFDTVEKNHYYEIVSEFSEPINIFDDIVFSSALNVSTFYVEVFKPVKNYIPVKIGKISKVKSDISLKISGLQQRLN